MPSTITPKTVCRAITGFVAKQNWEAFVEIGGDYRAQQNSTSSIQKFINWLAQCFDRDYATRTLSEVNYKKHALGRDFSSVAQAILMAKPAADGTVHIRFELDDEPLEIVSYPANPAKLFVRHCWADKELQDIDLPTLKTILLKEYIRLQKQCELGPAQIDLTAFNLTGLDLREMDFRNCSLPSLSRCRLTGIHFDMTTNFNSWKRYGCEMDWRTVDRLQQHEILCAKLVVQKFPDEESETFKNGDRISVPEFQKISTYNLEQVFSSDNPDLATQKRLLLRYELKEVKKCFIEMGQKGIAINLADVDLSDINLSGMDLTGANLYGAILTNTDLRNANLNHSDLRHARLCNTDMRNATFRCSKIYKTQFDIVIHGTHFSEVAQFICGPHDKQKISTGWLDCRHMVVHCHDN